MNDFIFTLLVLGCSHDLNVCREVAAEPMIFQTEQLCEDHTISASREVDDFPIAITQCIAVNQSQVAEIADAKWYFSADGSLHLSIPASDANLADLSAEPAVSPQPITVIENG